MKLMASEILDNQGRGEASWQWPSIHAEGRKFGAIAGGVALIGWLLLGPWVGWPLAVLTLCVLAFFRDPVRVTPQDDRAIVAPADGLVTLISKVAPPRELTVDDGRALRRCRMRRLLVSRFSCRCSTCTSIARRLAVLSSA